jgi:hypothetical protein
VVVAQELEAGLEDTTLRVLVRNAEHDDSASIVAAGQPTSQLQSHWSKSMPSDTFPRATESRTAPRPLLHACCQLGSHAGS